MTRFPTKVLSRHTDEDGTITLFVHARGLDVENDDLPRITTDPPIDIQQLKVNTSSDGKPVTLEFRLGSRQAPEAGEAITLVFEGLTR
ncbi:MAG: hypothetical protein JO331_04600 [Verrucomicrobia bacterium]|nr:hypothetical protein [Verrucomicrobiota bacterium]